MSNRGSLRAGLGLLVAACQSAPINPATDGDRTPRRLGTPAGEFPAPFGTIRAVMALPDGRLVVSDPGRCAASASSTAMRTATPISTCSRMTLRA